MLNSIIRLFIMNYLAKVKTLIYIWRISGLLSCIYVAQCL